MLRSPLQRLQNDQVESSLQHFDVDHIERRGRDLFEQACALDLEGIVAKRSTSKYIATERPSPYWLKIKNPKYSQAEGRAEMFDELAGRV